MSNLNLNFYQILEIDKKATQQEIRQKYLNLALKYHPDRNRNLKDSKYLECEEKFKLITKAFHILSNPLERKEYDKTIYNNINNNNNDKTFNQNETHFNIFYSYQFGSTNFTISSFLLNLANKLFTNEQIQSTKDFFDIFSKIYSNLNNNTNNTTDTNYLPEVIKNYKSFYKQKILEREKEQKEQQKEPKEQKEQQKEAKQEIILKKNLKEQPRDGKKEDKENKDKDKENKEVLDEPLTYNINVSLDDIYNGIKKELNVPRIRVCNFCLGKGYLGFEDNMSLCHICNGMLKRIDKKTFIIDIREQKLVFKGEGNQSLEKEPNDLIFHIHPKPNNKFTIINQYDLLHYHNISLMEIYTSITILLTHLDKKQYLIKYNNLENDNNNNNENKLINKMSIRVRDLGLPIGTSGRRGDLYIKFNIILPDLSNNDIKLLKSFKLFNKIENKQENQQENKQENQQENKQENLNDEYIKINAEITKINI